MSQRPTRSLSVITKLEQSLGWTLALIISLMPIHAFMSVWLGSLTGHQAVIQSWKEVALIAMTAATLVLVALSKTHRDRLKSPWIYAALAYIAVSGIVTLITMPEFKLVVFGAKINLEFIVAAMIAWVVATPALARRLVTAVLAGCAVVVIFGLMQIIALPPDFLTHFGYGPDTILPYQRIAEGTNTLRFPSTLGGPNQLGSYLILPICLIIALAWQKRYRWLLALGAIALVCLIGTHSRSAWVGTLIAASVAAVAGAPARIKRRVIYAVMGLAVASALAVPAIIATDSDLQYYVLHSSIENHDRSDLSNGQHVQSLEDGTEATASQPFGHGLGTAGPATFQTATPNIIENYYLQLSYEVGVLGLIAFMFTIILLGRKLWLAGTPLAQATALSFLGVGIICLLLPAWTDSTTALIAWICAGSAAAPWAKQLEQSRV